MKAPYTRIVLLYFDSAIRCRLCETRNRVVPIAGKLGLLALRQSDEFL